MLSSASAIKIRSSCSEANISGVSCLVPLRETPPNTMLFEQGVEDDELFGNENDKTALATESEVHYVDKNEMRQHLMQLGLE